jgi:Ser/Thr protein kinase RdoA (MazF antagonist)
VTFGVKGGWFPTTFDPGVGSSRAAGRWVPSLAMPLPAVGEEEAARLARAALGVAAVAVEPVPVGYGSRNWRVEAGGGRYVLKVGPPESAAKWGSARAAGALAAAAGVPAPRLVRWAAGPDAVVRVFAWVDGLGLGSLAGRPAAAARFGADLGAALAALHAVTRDAFSSRLDGSAPGFPRWATYLDHRMGQIRARARASRAFEPATLDRIGAEVAALAAAVDGVARPVLCHRDLHPDNLLVDGDGRLVAVLDWDMAEAWDPAGEWFKLDDWLFARLPAAAAPLAACYRAVHGDLPRWEERVRLVHLVEGLNAVANAAAEPDRAYLDARRARLAEVLVG